MIINYQMINERLYHRIPGFTVPNSWCCQIGYRRFNNQRQFRKQPILSKLRASQQADQRSAARSAQLDSILAQTKVQHMRLSSRNCTSTVQHRHIRQSPWDVVTQRQRTWSQRKVANQTRSTRTVQQSNEYMFKLQSRMFCQ